MHNKRFTLRILALFLFIIIATVSIAKTEKRVALVWGNTNYLGYDILPVCANDASTIGKKLNELGFDTLMLIDGNIEEMKNSIRRFKRLTKNADVAVFFYSGHAIYSPEYSIVPAKTELDPGDKLPVEYFSIYNIFSALENSKLSLLFFDACRVAGDLSGVYKGVIMPKIDYEERDYSPRGYTIFYATQESKKATTGTDGIMSPFSRALADHLSDRDEFRSVWQKIEIDVMNSTGQLQRPGTNETYAGDFYFNPVKQEVNHFQPKSKSYISDDASALFDTRSTDNIVIEDTIKKLNTRLEALEKENARLKGMYADNNVSSKYPVTTTSNETKELENSSQTVFHTKNEKDKIDKQEKAKKEAKYRAEKEARKKAAEEAKYRAEKEARKKAAQEAKYRAEKEARKKAAQKARTEADQKARKKADQKAKKKESQKQIMAENTHHYNKSSSDNDTIVESPLNKREWYSIEGEKHIGIDVSKHQGTIDWASLYNNHKNIEFAYIKATEGSNYVDPKYVENFANARSSGIKVGSYHYFTSMSAVKTQFNNFVSTVIVEDQDLIPVVDCENIGGWTHQQLRDSLALFIKMIEDHFGVKPMIYTSEGFFNRYLGSAFKDNPIWIAKFNNKEPNIGNLEWTLWQYGDRGVVSGVKANLVDVSRYNKKKSLKDLLLKPK